MSNLDQWHEIHDAYVTFFGDDHRPAAVECADRGDQRRAEIDVRPGAVWTVMGHGSTDYVPSNYVQILHGFQGTLNSAASKRDLGYAMLNGKQEWLEDETAA